MTDSSPLATPFPTLPRKPSLFRLVVDAVRGVETDLTQAPLGRALLMLAVPMILEMIMESIFAMVDVFWVAHLGASAIATVGLTESMMMIVYSLAMGVSIGAMALVARRIGEKDPRAAADTAAQGIWLGVALALAIGLGGVLFAPELLRLMGADARGSEERQLVHTRHAGRQRNRILAVLDQLRIAARATPRKRCGCCGSATR